MAQPRLADHLRVLGLAGQTLLGLVPLLLWLPLGPVLCRLVRARLARRLSRPPPMHADPPPADPAAWAGRTVFVVAGEASGDRMAARVVEAMRRECPGLRVRGYAGPATAAAGAALDRDIVAQAVMGVVAVVRTLPFWWRLCAETSAILREEPPDLFLTVDFPGLNGRLARWARRRAVPAVHLVAPAVWAYMPWRILRWRRAVDRLLTTFPHEATLLEGAGIPSLHVGHPAFEAPLAPPRTWRKRPSGETTVELLPGSRRREVLAHVPVLLDAAARVERALPGVSFRVRLAHPDLAETYAWAQRCARRRPTRLAVGGPLPEPGEPPLLGAMTSSGTATAERAAALVPMALFYRVPWWTRLGAAFLLTAPAIGLVNLEAGERVVPEHLQVGASGRRLAEGFLAVVGEEARWAEVRRRLERVRAALERPDVAARAARAVLAAGHASAARARPVGDSGTARRPEGGPS